DDPIQPVRDGMIKRKSKACQSLAATGGNGQREKSGCLNGLLSDMAENLAAKLVHGRLIIAPRGEFLLQPIAQCLQRVNTTPLDLLSFRADRRIKPLRRQKIRVHKRGKQHPNKEELIEATVLARAFPRSGQADRFKLRKDARMPLPATIIFNLAGNQPVRESTRHMFAAPICQAGVMPGDAKGENTAKAGTIKLHG